MSGPVPTLKAVLQSIRELTFDRFGVPGIVLKANSGSSFYVDGTGLHISNAAPSTTPPTAEAGASQIVVLPMPEPSTELPQYNFPPQPPPPVPDFVTVTLDGSESTPAGSNTLTGFQWSVVSGPDEVQIVEPYNDVTEVILGLPGKYVFQLTVVDNNGLEAIDWIEIIVYDPSVTTLIACAGADERFPPGAGQLQAIALSPVDNAIETYYWTKLSGPVSGSLSAPNVADPALTGLVKGVYTFEVTVTDSEGNEAVDQVTVIVSPPNTVHYLFSEFPAFQDLVAQFLIDQIPFAYTGYFTGTEPTNSLVPVINTALTADITLFRQFFFSDETVMEEIVYYYYDVLGIQLLPTDLQMAIPQIVAPGQYHLILYVSYYMTDHRRRYEAAAMVITNQYSDPTGAGVNFTDSLAKVEVNIGDVFSISEDPQSGFMTEDFNRVGSDNTWGDRYSFWYKLMLYLRNRIENDFGDYQLRLDTVFEGGIILDKALNYRTYYDSFPFTLSPLSRQIISYIPS